MISLRGVLGRWRHTVAVPPLRWQLIAVGAAALAFVLVYFASFGGVAWHPTDYEYIISCAWRMAHGEVPYRDFIYHKPPLTPMLHTVWLLLPGAMQVRASRLFFYVQVAVPSALPAAWALARGRVGWSWRLPALVAAGAVWAAHTFPVMPWYTTDGVMFASVATVAVLESVVAASTTRRWVARALASTGVTLALLAKQSFFSSCALLAGLTVAELGWAVWRRRHGALASLRPAFGLALASVAPAAAILGSFALWLRWTGALAPFRAQFESQSTPGAFREAGFGFPRGILWLVAAWALLPLLKLFDGPLRERRAWLVRGGAMWFVGFLALWTVEHVREGLGVLGFGLFYALCGSLVGHVLTFPLGRFMRRWWADVPRLDPVMLLFHAGVVLLAWGSQFSLGYVTPVLGLAGFALVLHVLLPEDRHWALDALPLWVMTAVVGTALWKANYDVPYRDDPRHRPNRDMGALFVKLQGIRTELSNFNRYADLKDAVHRYAQDGRVPFTVLADYPGAYWLFDVRNPIGLDWLYPPEMRGFEDQLLRELNEKKPVAIVPKDHAAPSNEDPQHPPCEQVDFGRHNVAAQAVARTWALVGQNRYFCVFERPAL